MDQDLKDRLAEIAEESAGGGVPAEGAEPRRAWVESLGEARDWISSAGTDCFLLGE